jgi:hypothetical protein
MTSPTKEYLERSTLVDKILKGKDFRDLDIKWENIRKNLPIMARLPDRVAFYSIKQRIGELYFTQKPMEIKKLNDSFEPYAKLLEERLKQYLA